MIVVVYLLEVRTYLGRGRRRSEAAQRKRMKISFSDNATTTRTQ